MKQMKPWAQSAFSAALLIAAVSPLVVQPAHAADLKDAVPSDMFLAVYGKQNPERDYQKQYYQDVWEAVEQSNIIERTMQIVQSRMSDGDVEQMLQVRDTLFKAVEPVQWEKLADLQEVVYAQKLDGVFTQQILMMRFPDDGAASLVEGITNLFRLAEGAANGNLAVDTETHDGTALTILRLPPGVPYSPVIGLNGDIFVLSSNPELAKQCLSLLNNPDAESKFDDPRVAAALSHLPEAEDALVFFDGRALSQQLNGIVAFIQGVGAGDEGAMRAAGLLDAVLKEVNVVDHEVTVEYTDGYRNMSATFGKSSANANDTVIGKMIGHQKPFEDWSKWVPADVNGFNINGGANMHPLYEWVTTKIPQMFPETAEGFARFDQIQERFDLNLDKDLFQSFSGESVSVTMPGPVTPFGPSAKSVSFVRCQQPERVKELLHRGIDALMQIPQVKAQGLSLQESTTLEGFEELKAGIFAMMGGMTPVIGFQDGWMAVGSHTDAVQTVLLTRGGESETFAETDRFREFGLEVSGSVYSISYANTGESIRQAAQGLQQVGAMLPMIMAMSGQGQNAPDLEPVQDFLQMLPSIGRIVAKFDFIDAKLSVSQPGPTADTYIRHAVTTIRPPQEAESNSRN